MPDATELITVAKDAAARSVDYYLLLEVDEAATREQVQRAWRMRSLKYHPDKAGAGFDKDRWEEFGLARDVLSDADARAAYDGARSAALQRLRERDLMSSRRRRFVDELEEAEGRGKRAREEDAARGAGAERERARQQEQGRRMLDERRRMVAEAEARERERGRKEDHEHDEKIAELERKIADKARKKAERRARKSGVHETTSAPGPPPAARPTPPPPVETERMPREAPRTTTYHDITMSDDPIAFWETQWPKTKARLIAAQATKEERRRTAAAS